jgi:3-oxoacyl-[acyl-carrier-protein] synthase-3
MEMVTSTSKTVEENDITSFKTGKLFFKYAVTNMADASELIMKKYLTNADVDWLGPSSGE